MCATLLSKSLDLVCPSHLSISLPEDEKAKREVCSWIVEGDVNTDPWAGYRYTGKLRPHYPLVSMSGNWDVSLSLTSFQFPEINACNLYSSSGARTGRNNEHSRAQGILFGS